MIAELLALERLFPKRPARGARMKGRVVRAWTRGKNVCQDCRARAPRPQATCKGEGGQGTDRGRVMSDGTAAGALALERMNA